MEKNIEHGARKNTLVLKKEEQAGRCKFEGRVVMTGGFSHKFGGQLLASMIIQLGLDKIWAEIHDEGKEGSDYLRVFTWYNEDNKEEITFWAIDDIQYITFLLPEEY